MNSKWNVHNWYGYALIPFALLAILLRTCDIASAQTAQDNRIVTVTPLVENGSYSRTYTYEDAGRAGYRKNGVKSDILQKGLSVEFHGKDGWSSKIAFSTGSVNTPTRFSVLTDGDRIESLYSPPSNAVIAFSGNSRSVQITEQYSRGLLTYSAGVDYRFHQYTDAMTIYSDVTSYSESEFTDSFFGPQFGISANPRFGKIGAVAAISVSPWMHHSGTYEFRLQNWGNSFYEGSTSAKAMNLNIGLSVQLFKNAGLMAGWRRAAIHTEDSTFLVGNAYGMTTPQTDKWSGFYLGLNLSK